TPRYRPSCPTRRSSDLRARVERRDICFTATSLHAGTALRGADAEAAREAAACSSRGRRAEPDHTARRLKHAAASRAASASAPRRSEEHTSELQSRSDLV